MAPPAAPAVRRASNAVSPSRSRQRRSRCSRLARSHCTIVEVVSSSVSPMVTLALVRVLSAGPSFSLLLSLLPLSLLALSSHSSVGGPAPVSTPPSACMLPAGAVLQGIGEI